MTEVVQTEENNVETTESFTPQPIVKRSERYEHKAAGFWIRFWAYTADILVLSSIGMLLIKPIFRLFSFELNNPTWYAPFTIITSFIFYAYFVLMTKFFHQTVGKMIFGIQVITLEGGKLSWSTVLFREWVGRLLSVIPLNIPYVTIAFTPNKQAIHDFIADTLVVHEAVYDKKEIVEVEQSLAVKELQEQNII